jgi:hypothetical protein
MSYHLLAAMIGNLRSTSYPLNDMIMDLHHMSIGLTDNAPLIIEQINLNREVLSEQRRMHELMVSDITGAKGHYNAVIGTVTSTMNDTIGALTAVGPTLIRQAKEAALIAQGSSSAQLEAGGTDLGLATGSRTGPSSVSGFSAMRSTDFSKPAESSYVPQGGTARRRFGPLQ